MTQNRLSDLARTRTRSTLPQWAEEGTVLEAAGGYAGPLVYVELESQPGVRHGPFYWTGNGKMWRAGDWCMVLTSVTGARLAHVWCSGPPIGGDPLEGEVDFDAEGGTVG